MATSRSNDMTTTRADAGLGVDTESIGRFLYAVPFLAFGAMHFLNAGALAGVVPGWLPGGLFWVYLTGAANLAAGIAIAANRYVRATAAGLVALLAAYILTVHLPGLFTEGMAQMALQSLLKDVGLAGGALLLIGSRD